MIISNISHRRSLPKYFVLVYTTKVNSAFCTRWLASSEVISQVLFTSEQPKKKRLAFVGILSEIKLPFGPLVIQLEWYIPKQLFTSVSVKVLDTYLHFSELFDEDDYFKYFGQRGFIRGRRLRRLERVFSCTHARSLHTPWPRQTRQLNKSKLAHQKLNLAKQRLNRK